MEILKLIAKETDASFCMVSFDSFGKIINSVVDILQKKMETNEPMTLRRRQKNISLDSSGKRDELVDLYEKYFNRQREPKYPAISGFHDLPITARALTDYDLGTAINSNLLLSRSNPNVNFHSYQDPMSSYTDLDVNAIKLAPNHITSDAVGTLSEHQMTEIRQMFTKLYMGRQRRNNKLKNRKLYKQLHPKEHKFRDERSTRSETFSFESSTSDDSDSADFNEIDREQGEIRSVALSPKKLYRPYTDIRRSNSYEKHAVNNHGSRSSQSFSVGGSSVTSDYNTMRPTTGRTAARQPWRPVGGGGSTSRRTVSGRGQTTDRSAGITDRFMQERLKWENNLLLKNRTKAVQASDNNTSVVRVRTQPLRKMPTLQPKPRSSDKLQLTSYTQTQENASTADSGLQTIRELVHQNSRLLDVLEKDPVRANAEAAKEQRIALNRDKIFNRITKARRSAQERDLALAAQGKLQVLQIMQRTMVNDEIKKLGSSSTSRTQMGPLAEIASPKPNSKRNVTYKTRQDQIADRIRRNEERKRLHQQSLYKTMYEKLVENTTARQKHFAEVSKNELRQPQFFS